MAWHSLLLTVDLSLRIFVWQIHRSSIRQAARSPATAKIKFLVRCVPDFLYSIKRPAARNLSANFPHTG